MKKLVCVLLCLFFYSCKAQVSSGQELTEIDLKNKDIIAFSFSEDKIASVEPVYGNELYNKKGLIILTRNWASYGIDYFTKVYTFIQGRDTMNISCSCGQEVNFYIKNLEFKKGSYKIERKERGDFAKASTLFTDKALSKTLVINSYNRWNNGVEDTFIDVMWEELNFIVIDAQHVVFPTNEKRN